MPIRPPRNQENRRATGGSPFVGPSLAFLLVTALSWQHGAVQLAKAQTGGVTENLKTGKEIYYAGCIACHGPDGKGMPQAVVGFDNPIPDFTDCQFGEREADPDWYAVVHNGGPARGFSEIMPEFSQALKPEQINEVVQYLRGFCTDKSWPRGELNLPRSLATEKAFPEDEVVITTSVALHGRGFVHNRIVYEKRFGARNQIEVVLPVRFQHQGAVGGWAGGFGDAALGYKRALLANNRTGTIVSAATEFVMPTGDRRRLGFNGTNVFEFFGMAGQVLPKESFLQFQGGVRLPTHTDEINKSSFVRFVGGKSFFEEEGLGRAWTPMFEVTRDQMIQAGYTNWDVIPQFQVTLSKRQHVMFALGARIPVSHKVGRSTQLMFYLLWDFYDGGLWDGW
jgi:mono/diheme cytochrome c family protein